MPTSPSQHWDSICFGPVHGATVAVSLCVPDLLCKTLLPCNHPSSRLLKSFHLFFLSDEVGGLVDFPFRTKCSEVSHSLVFASSRLLQKEASLMVTELCTNSQVQQKVIRSYFIAMIFQQNKQVFLQVQSIWYLVIGHFGNLRHKFYLMKWASNPILQWLLLQHLCHCYTSVSCRKITIVGQRVWNWVGVYVLFWNYRVPRTMTISQ